jgi:glycosyltransferase involved in cell wall biosynthesis
MERTKKIIFTVTSDLTYDQRMDRICTTLANVGYDVVLCGRLKKNSLPEQDKPYRQQRLKCFFETGKLFYLEFNLRLFFYLLRQQTDLICGIDLDTALPAFTVARLKKIPFVYDAHEYFTQMEEVVRRPLIQKMWLLVERLVVLRTRYAYTVSGAIASLLEKEYGTHFEVIRNVSMLQPLRNSGTVKDEKYIIYAGAVNEGRGLEQLIDAMPAIRARLYICGEGDVLDDLLKKVKELQLEDKVIFKGYVVPQELRILINNAYIGYLLLTDKGLSYYYSLANKFFDYMHAGIPQVTINFPEYQLINKEFEVASLVELDREQIIMALNRLLSDEQYYETLAKNALKAREIYNWQAESQKLIEFYNKIFTGN